MNWFVKSRLNVFVCLVLVSLVLFPAAAAMAQQGGRVPAGGDGSWRGGGRGRPTQQRPDKPPEERFIRVCRVLLFSKDQIKKAKSLHENMQASIEKLTGEKEKETLSEDEVKERMEKIDNAFESGFCALLDDDQKSKMEELKENGTLEGRWW